MGELNVGENTRYNHIECWNCNVECKTDTHDPAVLILSTWPTAVASCTAVKIQNRDIHV